MAKRMKGKEVERESEGGEEEEKNKNDQLNMNNLMNRKGGRGEHWFKLQVASKEVRNLVVLFI